MTCLRFLETLGHLGAHVHVPIPELDIYLGRDNTLDKMEWTTGARVPFLDYDSWDPPANGMATGAVTMSLPVAQVWANGLFHACISH